MLLFCLYLQQLRIVPTIKYNVLLRLCKALYLLLFILPSCSVPLFTLESNSHNNGFMLLEHSLFLLPLYPCKSFSFCQDVPALHACGKLPSTLPGLRSERMLLRSFSFTPNLNCMSFLKEMICSSLLGTVFIILHHISANIMNFNNSIFQ